MNNSWGEAGAPDAGQGSSPESTQAGAGSSPPSEPDLASERVRELISGFQDTGKQDDDQVDDQAALRWRRALLRLSETFLDAAEERRDLSPILLGALHNALEQLLIHGNDDDLMSLEEWLSHEAPPPVPIQDAVSDAARAVFSGEDRRSSGVRRNGERRRTDRRRKPAGRRATDRPSPA